MHGTSERESSGGRGARSTRRYGFRRIALFALLALVCAPGPPVPGAQRDPEPRRGRADLDVRSGTRAPRAVQAEWLARSRWLEREAGHRFGPDAVLSVRPDGAALHHLHRTRGFLSGPSQAEPLEIAREFLFEHQDLFGLSPLAIDELQVVKSYRSSHNGVRHLLFQQAIAGVPVFHGEVRINLTRSGEVINVGGNVYPDLAEPPAAVLRAEDAIRRAATSIGAGPDREIVALTAAVGAERASSFDAGPGLQRVSASQAIFPIHGESRAAWVVRMQERGTAGEHAYQVLIDAVDGRVLHRINRGLSVTLEGDVFPESPDPEGDGPDDDGDGSPDDELTRLSFAADPVASPLGWFFPGETTTQGNNVISSVDVPDQNDQNGLKPDGGVDLEFFFPFENEWDELGSFGDQETAVTNVHYHSNRFHDYLYGLGFDEAAGNFQEDNFGRGGLGGDRVYVDVQDAAGLGLFNGANFFPEPDGQNPRMRFMLFNQGGRRRDSALDSDIIIHEYAHGLSTRLVGGALHAGCVYGIQSGAMGEGWSDYFAIDDTNDPAVDDTDGPELYGEYTTDNHNAGMRPYAYSTEMSVNPTTYGDLCGSGICGVHANGQIWANALFTARRNLIDDHGPAGREIMNLLIVDAMKLSPCNPSMLDMREAILLADRIDNLGANRCSLWSAFSERGFGSSATSPGGAEVHEAFDMPPGCAALGTVAFVEDAYLVGDDVEILLGDLDLSGSGTVQVQVTSELDVETVTLSETEDAGTFLGTLATAAAAVSQSGNGALEITGASRIVEVSYADADDGTGSPANAEDQASILRALLVEGAEGPALESGWSHYSVAGLAGDRWRRSVGGATEGSTAWHFWPDEPGADVRGDQLWGSSALESPDVDLRGVAEARLDFLHQWSFGGIPGDANFNGPFPGEGGIVEARALPDGEWQQIAPAGDYPSYMAGSMHRTQSDRCFAPMRLRDGYALASSGTEQALFDLSSFAGNRIRLRFRAGTDCASLEPIDGWRIDRIRIGGTNGSAGEVWLDRSGYACSDTLSVSVSDADLEGAGALAVIVDSTATGDSETLLLTERSDLAGSFVGSLPLALTPVAAEDGLLAVRDVDTIVAEYTDADDGMGGFGLIRTAEAQVSCKSELTHFSEGFESGGAGWSHGVESGDVVDRWALDGRWTRGGRFAFLSGPPDDLVFDSSASGATVLESPQIVLPSGTTGTHRLRFWHLLDMDDYTECAGGNAFVVDGGLLRVEEDGSPSVTLDPEGGYPDQFGGSGCQEVPPYADEFGWAIDWPHEYREARFDLTSGGLSEDVPFRLRFTFHTVCTPQCFLPQGWWVDDVEVYTEIVDSDGDGLEDVSDPCPFDPGNDADGDSQCADVDPDDDNDGLDDDEDNCPAADNPSQLDGDLDLVGDACDNCPDDPNFAQADADADGVGDACDRCPAVPSSVDTDGDGWQDACDNCPGDPNPDQEDLDQDGFGEDCDPCPLEADADGDGAGCETGDNCPSDFDPSYADGEGDGVGDVCDNCPGVFNTDQVDADGDGIGDDCDACLGLYDDASLDADSDLRPDACDNCPVDPNPAQDDADGDGLGDACDSCPNDPGVDVDGDGLCGAADLDLDGDGVPNLLDNCNQAANTDQSDADGDGVGDACDNCNQESNSDQEDLDGDSLGDDCDPCPADATNDPDADGICNDGDNCSLVANPSQTDTDEDGVGDPCDNCPLDPNAQQLDADGDTFGDACDFDDGVASCVTATAEVGGLEWDASTLSWQVEPTADSYNVHRGDGNFENTICLAVRTTDTGVGDTDVPAPGKLYTYVTAAVNGCGQGTLGFGTDSVERQSAACDPDGDADGVDLAQDNCPYTHNPGQIDTDGDARGDACDNCPATPNSDQIDLDADGLGDACDSCPLDPQNDVDEDGFCAADDNCPIDWNESQADDDGDGLGDACDLCPGDPGNDPDGDTVCAADDNCPGVANLDQHDDDGDGLGNACDDCPLDPDNDIDGDTICGDEDNCPLVPNPGQENGDLDPVGDACDNCPADDNPVQEDLDMDGVGDVCDNCDSANPAQVDTDGDGVGDGPASAEFGSSMLYEANLSEPDSGMDWIDPLFDDGEWSAGLYGVGYEDPPGGGATALILTEVTPDVASIFTRATFWVDEPLDVTRFLLGCDYDDGYAVWLNGIEIFRSPEMPAEPLSWNTPAAFHESSNAAEPDYTPYSDLSGTAIPLLQAGDNDLAIGVWNAVIPSSDLVVVPRILLAIDDGCDNCPLVSNPGQEDADADGIGDACDP